MQHRISASLIVWSLVVAACGSGDAQVIGKGGSGTGATGMGGSGSGATGTGGSGSGATGAGGSGSGATGAGGTTTSRTASTSTGTGGNTCHAQSDCTTGSICETPSLPAYCGTCDPVRFGTCMSDAECQDAGADSICGMPCTCFNGGAKPTNHCTRGCSSDPDCGPSQTCGPTHRCAPAACSGTGGCTANFTCAQGTCTAKACTKDSDCDGYCVMGRCSAAIGFCDIAAP
jgi:hypothetical protein